jgi:hypothetical protein
VEIALVVHGSAHRDILHDAACGFEIIFLATTTHVL